MFASLLQTRCQADQFGFIFLRQRDDGFDCGLAFGQRAGLVHDQRVNLLENARGLRVLDEDSDRAPRPVPTMIAMGVASPSAQGHAMISTATALTRRVRQARFRTDETPDDKGEHGDRNDRGTNHAATRSAKR